MVEFVFLDVFHQVWLKGFRPSLLEVKSAALCWSHFFEVDFSGCIKIELFARFSLMYVEILHILTPVKLFDAVIIRAGIRVLFLRLR